MPDTTTTTISDVDNTHPSWYPQFLKELEARYPEIYAEITSDVIGRHAEQQVRQQVRQQAPEPHTAKCRELNHAGLLCGGECMPCPHGILRAVLVCPACDPERQAKMEQAAAEQAAHRLAGK